MPRRRNVPRTPSAAAAGNTVRKLTRLSSAPAAGASGGAVQVLRYDGDKMLVVFESVGYKTLSAPLVAKTGIVRRA